MGGTSPPVARTRRRGVIIAVAVVAALVAAMGWWYGRPAARHGGPLHMGDVTYSSMNCRSNTVCTSAEALLINTGSDSVTLESIELLAPHEPEKLNLEQPELYTPSPEMVGPWESYPPEGADRSLISSVKDTRIPPEQNRNANTRQTIVPIRPTSAGYYWWEGYRVRYTYNSIRYVVEQPSWVAVCVDQVGFVPEGGCGLKRPAG